MGYRFATQIFCNNLGRQAFYVTEFILNLETYSYAYFLQSETYHSCSANTDNLFRNEIFDELNKGQWIENTD
jgi:hypothetical protein